METDRILCGDALEMLRTLPDNSVHCCVTSPPYYALRDYGVDGQIGREDTPAQYVARLTDVFSEVRRVLRPSGTLWLNIADTYAGKGNQGDSVDPKYPNGRTGQTVAINRRVEGCKAKDMIGIPWMLAFALRDSGWYLRSDIIWMKANPMPESCKDRPSRCYEHVFLLTKSRSYYYDAALPICCGNRRTGGRIYPDEDASEVRQKQVFCGYSGTSPSAFERLPAKRLRRRRYTTAAK